jgi:hypothetical protein
MAPGLVEGCKKQTVLKKAVKRLKTPSTFLNVVCQW